MSTSPIHHRRFRRRRCRCCRHRRRHRRHHHRRRRRRCHRRRRLLNFCFNTDLDRRNFLQGHQPQMAKSIKLLFPNYEFFCYI